mmetsp:Transcript_18851/g.40588  ORF Transcript_18851/g.40588 Transcript_18851/m.40588 type:complete len:567 (-) Transcript_18851:1282-2982(-)
MSPMEDDDAYELPTLYCHGAGDGTDLPTEGSASHINMALPTSVLLYIFSYLGAKDLCCAGATCKTWHDLSTRGAAANQLWHGYYTARWRVVSSPPTGVSWCEQFSTRMRKLGSWSGRYTLDHLYSHKAGVRCCKLLPSKTLLVTGSLDKTVRLWDLKQGMPISTSKPHGGTVRCVAMDEEACVSGCSDNTLRIWLPQYQAMRDSCSAAMPPLFDLTSPFNTIRVHTGPVSSLCMTECALYSGSWDCTVRIHSRLQSNSWELASCLTYDDWVFSVAARGKHLLVAAGVDVYCHDLSTGQVVRKFQNLHEGHVCCVEGTQNSRMLFTGAGDGLVLAHDLRMKEPSCVMWHHNAGVHGLAFEDPWLASASSDGTVLMMNTEEQRKAATGMRALSSNCRQFMTPSGPALCVDIAEQWLACGSESETVRVWDFTRAEECAQRAAAAKAARNSRRGPGHNRGPRGMQYPVPPHRIYQQGVQPGAGFYAPVLAPATPGQYAGEPRLQQVQAGAGHGTGRQAHGRGKGGQAAHRSGRGGQADMNGAAATPVPERSSHQRRHGGRHGGHKRPEQK